MEIILGIGMVILGIFAFWTAGCVMVKCMFKIADWVFGN